MKKKNRPLSHRLLWTFIILLLLHLPSAIWFAAKHRHPGGDPATDSRNDLPAFEDEVLAPHLAAAIKRHAPWIVHGSGAKAWRDIPTQMDFDGDWIGRNNEQSLAERRDLAPTVYYAAVESETHLFLTYHLFHPLDWEPMPNLFLVGRWHENDGESVQVVVRKADDHVVLLATQAHLHTHLYRRETSTLRAKTTWDFEKEPIRFREGHPVIYVERGGHGIYGHPLEIPSVEISDYELLPIHDSLWKFYRQNRHLGDGGIVDGAFDYHSENVRYTALPRHFDSDRLSVLALWKFDAGIVPFAFSHSLQAKDLGVLFFEPTIKWRKSVGGWQQWSDAIIYNPYIPPPNHR